MKIGKYAVHSIETGNFALDGGTMFGIIPKPIWEKQHPPDEKNKITMSLRALLLISDTKKILVDTGMGDKWDDKAKSIYNIDNHTHTLSNTLKKMDVSESDITDVFLTHLHFDHAGGSTIKVNGKIIPTFPNAVYHIQKENLDWALNATERDKGSYLPENFVPLIEEGMLNLIDKDQQYFDDELEIIIANGHTSAQQLLKISDSSQTLFYCGDLFPFASHLHLPVIMGYDLQPLITLQEKKNILPIAVEENWKMFFEHDFTTLASTVQKTDKGYSAHERFEKL